MAYTNFQIFTKCLWQQWSKSSWLSNSTCQHCGSENNQHKAIISLVNKAFIIQLKITIDKKQITAYNIKEVPKMRLKICGSTFKV